MAGKLYLIPTPIDEESPLEKVAFDLLMKASTSDRNSSVFAIEDLRPGRRRWLAFGLPREIVDNFVLYNEHSAKESSLTLLKELQSGKNVYLMSDGGLPAFCDPGVELVDLCHKKGITVTSSPFCNSVSLALALSGFNHRQFVFEGFLPQKNDERIIALGKVINEHRTVVLMDTPYRLQKLLKELQDVFSARNYKKEIFLACDLNSSQELLLRGSLESVIKRLENFKREFILIIS